MPPVGHYILKNSVLFIELLDATPKSMAFMEYIVHEFWTTQYASQIFLELNPTKRE